MSATSKIAFNDIIWRKMAIILLQAFASGLPIALCGSTLQAWFAVSGVGVMGIGALTLIGQPYVYKFLWAPIFDRYSLRFLGLGRRGGWIVAMQALLAFSLVAMGFLNPIQAPLILGGLALVTSFLSATQDISIDAYRTEVLTDEERGMGNACLTLGYRVAMLVSGGMALILADHIGWRDTYFLMAFFMLLQIGVTLFSPHVSEEKKPTTLHNAVTAPWREFLSRDKAIALLLFVILYKLTDAVSLSLGSKFLLDVGFSLTQIGTIYKGVGMVAVLLGSFVGGALMMRISMYRALMWFGFMQAASNLLFAALAFIGKNMAFLSLSVFAEGFCGGLATIAFLSFLMKLCNKSYTATQYALFSAIAALGRVYIGPLAGWLAKSCGVEHNLAWGWGSFYLVSFLIVFPSLIILKYFLKDCGLWIAD